MNTSEEGAVFPFESVFVTRLIAARPVATTRAINTGGNI
jgi:hypothetical protein